MNYREGITFTGKCLTLSIYPDRTREIMHKIRKGDVDWVRVVRMSSSFLVLPALWIQLKRAGLQHELPADLTTYFEDLTLENRRRNIQILDQIYEVTGILNGEEIYPIFLKGSAHLLKNIYDDPAERMIGDIDLLVNQEEIFRAVLLLEKQGYAPLTHFYPEMLRSVKHYPRLVNYDRPCAVEVHFRVLRPPHDESLTYQEIFNDKQLIPGDLNLYVPSNRHMIIHNVLNAQINDKSWLKGDPNMRQMYDLLMLSRLEDPVQIPAQYHKYPVLHTTWLSMCNRILEYPGTDDLKLRFANRLQLIPLSMVLKGYRYMVKFYRALLFLLPRFIRYFSLPVKALFRRDIREGLMIRLKDPKWYGRHLGSYIEFFRA